MSPENMMGPSDFKYGPLAAIEKPKALPKRLAPLPQMPKYERPIGGPSLAPGPSEETAAMYERPQQI